ncbi:MAG: M20/M25/M40 family metallo-hydrolase [Muribaculaceae bacterium]|nr:M20/M25/M40 family metallo-hydrolase [Muribaculaceae bacterium]
MLNSAVELLKRMVSTPSVSREESAVASLLYDELRSRGLAVRRYRNNVWTANFSTRDSAKPLLMLNSHIDTVKPAAGWTLDPYKPEVSAGCIYGLGSNDAGASVVSLIEAFCAMRSADLSFDMLLALTAEEEVGGENGMRAFLPMLGDEGLLPDMVLVGEPTGMQPAIAERGLVVLDCIAHGRAGHAARREGDNAIYRAMADIDILRKLTFPKESQELGPIGIAVTMIQAGTAHNVIPAECRFTVDVRTTDAYTNEQTAQMISEAIESDATPRSTRVRASVISRSHPMVMAACECGGEPFASPTTSDMSLLGGIPSLKMGPGESKRSHTPDEYIEIDEINAGIDGYIKYLKCLSKQLI